MTGYAKFVVSPCDSEDEDGNYKRTWTVMRAGECFADLDTREQAEKYRAQCDTEETTLWGMTPKERIAILDDRQHKLHDMARFLDSKFKNFRTYRQRK